jgi:hypothetical protein
LSEYDRKNSLRKSFFEENHIVCVFDAHSKNHFGINDSEDEIVDHYKSSILGEYKSEVEGLGDLRLERLNFNSHSNCDVNGVRNI